MRGAWLEDDGEEVNLWMGVYVTVKMAIGLHGGGDTPGCRVRE
jgi:hypothetical protein